MNITRYFILYLVAFALHRGFSFQYLAPSDWWMNSNMMKAFVVGLGSDLWVATLLTILSDLLARLAPVKFRTFAPRALISICLAALCMHQVYVEFFGVQIQPFHFKYLTEADFLGTSAFAPLTNIRTYLVVGPSLGLLFALKKVKFTNRKSSALIFVIVLGLLGHSLNNHFRQSLKVPEYLQLNVLEKTYAASMEEAAHVSREVSLADVKDIAETLRKDVSSLNAQKKSETLQSIMRSSPLENNVLSPLGQAIKEKFDQLVLGDQKPLIMVVLMESLRPADIAAIDPKEKSESITPFLDGLVKSPSTIFFRNAYSTGNVTRGGQEAVWCGHLSSQKTSYMRNHPKGQVTCLPQLISKLPEAKRGHLFWFHGGRGDFDGQINFWERQMVNHLMSLQSFKLAISPTEYGVPDHTFFQQAASELQVLRTKSPYTVGMNLSLSNHPPWTVPNDLPSDSLKSKKFHYPIHATTAYSDAALEHYFKRLKDFGLWDKSLVFVVSDHGTIAAPSYFPGRYPKDVERAELQSHIFLSLAGGVIENVLSKNPSMQKDRMRNEFVSQADIAAFQAYLVGASEFRSFGESLFSERRAPVVSNLGPSIYFPKNKIEVPMKELNNNFNGKDVQSELLYYRAFLWMMQLEGFKNI
jgi:phosphoglycerol transferase MdoB-like AlkP superfamily enzyme